MVLRAALIFGTASAVLINAPAQSLRPSEPDVLRALNQLRAKPASYIAVLRRRRPFYRGNLLEIPGQPDLVTQEGVRPLDEAVAALQSMHAALGPITLSAGLSRAAADHVLDTGRLGTTGHAGSDGNDFTERIARYGTWSGEIGEDIGYGAHDAQDVIVNLLIDDGVADRGHRKSLLDPRWRYAGIACGFHARYGTMCAMDFASSYQEKIRAAGRAGR